MTARIRLVEGELEVTRARVTVVSPSTTEETTWKGGCLDRVIRERLSWVLAILGARESTSSDELTWTEESERDRDSFGPGPVKAWKDAHARVVLYDDEWGSGYLTIWGESPALLGSLRATGWGLAMSR